MRRKWVLKASPSTRTAGCVNISGRWNPDREGALRGHGAQFGEGGQSRVPA
jgi:hypothetical protein